MVRKFLFQRFVCASTPFLSKNTNGPLTHGIVYINKQDISFKIKPKDPIDLWLNHK